MRRIIILGKRCNYHMTGVVRHPDHAKLLVAVSCIAVVGALVFAVYVFSPDSIRQVEEQVQISRAGISSIYEPSSQISGKEESKYSRGSPERIEDVIKNVVSVLSGGDRSGSSGSVGSSASVSGAGEPVSPADPTGGPSATVTDNATSGKVIAVTTPTNFSVIVKPPVKPVPSGGGGGGGGGSSVTVPVRVTPSPDSPAANVTLPFSRVYPVCVSARPGGASVYAETGGFGPGVFVRWELLRSNLSRVFVGGQMSNSTGGGSGLFGMWNMEPDTYILRFYTDNDYNFVTDTGGQETYVTIRVPCQGPVQPPQNVTNETNQPPQNATALSCAPEDASVTYLSSSYGYLVNGRLVSGSLPVPGEQDIFYPDSDSVGNLYATVTTYVTGAQMKYSIGGTNYSCPVGPNSNMMIKFARNVTVRDVKIHISGRGYPQDATSVAYGFTYSPTRNTTLLPDVNNVTGCNGMLVTLVSNNDTAIQSNLGIATNSRLTRDWWVTRNYTCNHYVSPVVDSGNTFCCTSPGRITHGEASVSSDMGRKWTVRVTYPNGTNSTCLVDRYSVCPYAPTSLLNTTQPNSTTNVTQPAPSTGVNQTQNCLRVKLISSTDIYLRYLGVAVNSKLSQNWWNTGNYTCNTVVGPAYDKGKDYCCSVNGAISSGEASVSADVGYKWTIAVTRPDGVNKTCTIDRYTTCSV